LAFALGLFVFQVVLNVGQLQWNETPIVNHGKINVFLAIPQRCQGKDTKDSHRE